MEGSAELPTNSSELSRLAPGIPEGLEKLGHFNTYSIDTSTDGTSATVSRLRKMGNQHNSGYRVVDQQKFTDEDVEKSEAWIASVYDKLRMDQITPSQHHQLGIIDEIVQVISADFKAAKSAKSPGGKPTF